MRFMLEDVMNYIEEEDAKFIRLAFRDAYEVQKNISIMPETCEVSHPETSRVARL